MKKTVKLLSVFLALVLVLGALASCSGKKKLTASDYLEKMFENSANSAASFNTCLEEIIIDPSVIFGEDSGIEDMSLKLHSNESGEMVLSANVGTNSDSTDATIYYSGNSVVISSGMLEESYGLSLTDLESLMSSMGGIEGDFDAEMGAASGLIGTILTDNAEMVGKLTAKYVEVIVEAIDKAAEQKVDLTANTVTVNVKFNGDSAKKVIKDVYNTLKKDKDLRKFIEDITKTVSPDGSQEVLDAYNSFFENDDMLDEVFETINENDFEIGFSVTSDKQYQIKKFTVSGEFNGNSISVSIDAPSDNDISISVTAGAGGERMSVKANVKTVKAGNASKTEATLTMDMGYGEMTAKLFTIDIKENGEFTISVSSDLMMLFGGEVMAEDVMSSTLAEIKGIFKESGKTSELTVLSITNVTGETINVGVTVKTTLDAAFPKFPTDYKLITELNENDLNEIMGAVMGDSVVGHLIGLFESLTPDFDEGYDYPDFDEDDVVYTTADAFESPDEL